MLETYRSGLGGHGFCLGAASNCSERQIYERWKDKAESGFLISKSTASELTGLAVKSGQVIQSWLLILQDDMGYIDRFHAAGHVDAWCKEKLPSGCAPRRCDRHQYKCL